MMALQWGFIVASTTFFGLSMLVLSQRNNHHARVGFWLATVFTAWGLGCFLWGPTGP